MSRERDAGYWDDLISEYGHEAVNRAGAYQPPVIVGVDLASGPDMTVEATLPVGYFRDAQDDEDGIP